MTFWELLFIVKITTGSLSFQRLLTSSICPQIQLRAVAQARLTPGSQRDQLPPLILIYTQIFRNIKQAVKESCMLCPREHDAPFPLLQQKVVFRVKVMVTPKTTNKPGPWNSRLPSRCWTDTNQTTASKRGCAALTRGQQCFSSDFICIYCHETRWLWGSVYSEHCNSLPTKHESTTTTGQAEEAMPC